MRFVNRIISFFLYFIPTQSYKSPLLKQTQITFSKVVKNHTSSNLRIKFIRRNKPGHILKELEEHRCEWLTEFLDQANTSQEKPGRKDIVHVGKENGQRKYPQKRSILENIKDLLKIVNGHSDINDSSHSKFYKKISF